MNSKCYCDGLKSIEITDGKIVCVMLKIIVLL